MILAFIIAECRLVAEFDEMIAYGRALLCFSAIYTFYSWLSS